MAQCNQNAQIDSELCTDWRSHNHYENLEKKKPEGNTYGH